MNYRLSFLTLLTGTASMAQINFTNPDNGAVVSYQTKEIDQANIKAEGSPYFDKDFKWGQILMNGEVKTTGNLRYNAVNNEIELQKGEKEYTAVLKRNYISARIDNKLFKLYPYFSDINETARIGYFIPLNDGKIKLLYKPEKKLRRGKTGTTSYDRTIPPRFIDISSYYIQQGEEPATKIYLRNKYFYHLLGKENVRDFIKNHDLNLSNEEDAIKLLDYYNKKMNTN